MFQRLTNSSELEAAHQQITALVRQHAEWFFTLSQSETLALRRHELDLAVSHNRLVLSCWTENGIRSWRILGWYWTGEVLLLQASRRMGAEQPIIELVPRASASAVAATIRASRQLRCDRLAQLAGDWIAETRIERSALSPGIKIGRGSCRERVMVM